MNKKIDTRSGYQFDFLLYGKKTFLNEQEELTLPTLDNQQESLLIYEWRRQKYITSERTH